MRGYSNPEMTPIFREAVISLGALPDRFHSPHSFAKPPEALIPDFPYAIQCDSGHANRFEPFFFLIFALCRPHGPSSMLPSYALLAGFIRLILL